MVCTLCPHSCTIENGDYGICKVRQNRQGNLYSTAYGYPISLTSDPIEKKPLYHFYPGRDVLSAGTAGCNLRCRFCQNYSISQSATEQFPGLKYVSPHEIAEKASSIPGNTGIAFTYNEPVVWFEYMLDIATISREKQLENIVISNGYINSKPLEKLLEVITAFNIDLKSLNDKFYRDFTGGSAAPVLRTLKTIKLHGVHLEVTHLVVTGLNDTSAEFKKLTSWIAEELGPDTVLHISRYYPAYKMDAPPTSPETIREFSEIASEKLNYVYTGNMPFLSAGNDTICRGCQTVVIKRRGYHTEAAGVDRNGNCKKCNLKIVKTG